MRAACAWTLAANLRTQRERRAGRGVQTRCALDQPCMEKPDQPNPTKGGVGLEHHGSRAPVAGASAIRPISCRRALEGRQAVTNLA